MRADERGLSCFNHLHLGIVPMRYGSQDTVPNACVTPKHEAIVAGGVGASSRVDTPWRSRPQDPENAVQDTPVIHTRDASRHARKDWRYQPLFGVGEGMSLVQDSLSELESRWHAKLQSLLCPQALRLGPLDRPVASRPKCMISAMQPRSAHGKVA